MNKITALLLVLIGLLQYRLWYGDGNVRELQRLNDRIAELQQEGARRRERNAALQAEVDDLKHGLDAIEEHARQDMDMIKPGEVFVQVIDPQTEEQAPPTSPVKDGKPKRDAEMPHPTESTPAPKKPQAPATTKSAPPHTAPVSKPKPPKPKPAASPQQPAEAVYEAPAEEPIEERPLNLEPE